LKGTREARCRQDLGAVLGGTVQAKGGGGRGRGGRERRHRRRWWLP